MKKSNEAAAIAIEAVAADTMPAASNDSAIGSVSILERFQADNVAVSAKAEQSAIAQQTIRQTLAQASDLLDSGEGLAKEARTLTSKAGLSLYQGRTNGLFSDEQISALLGDQFGYKMKADGKTPSKTPLGEGEAIRKRVMRMNQAHDFVVSGEATRFFEALDAEEVALILSGLEKGDSIYSAYDAMTELSRKSKENVPTAYNPKVILKIVDVLTTRPLASVEAFTGEGGADLIKAYQALVEAFNVIMAAPVDLAEQDLAF